ncbi:hypothetical protein [Flammeovirga aprica]|uniref:Uncharacterized protein n=1 Tax=Flammeovirga aprica JL-4 TaxID=694437 RepID=A0A7X9XBE0_9BACT|nr:hypothetical protein [Flammeovirga aprica]NME70558.1 hypothetical protein [Flammeovirga aprica JL-4]
MIKLFKKEDFNIYFINDLLSNDDIDFIKKRIKSFFFIDYIYNNERLIFEIQQNLQYKWYDLFVTGKVLHRNSLTGYKEYKKEAIDLIDEDDFRTKRVKITETIQSIYDKWRWYTYNKVDPMLLERMVNDYKQRTLDGNPYSQNIYYIRYTDELIEKYERKYFLISDQEIKTYDEDIFSNYSLENESNYMTLKIPPYRSIFIENCFIDIHQYSMPELIEKVKQCTIYYYWWDVLKFDEFCDKIISMDFLQSTRKLVTTPVIKQYIKSNFNTKNDLINHIFSNFTPRISNLEELNSTFRNDVIFQYEWLFANDLKRAVRIFENECRIVHNEKIIGAFYNEDILFREIRNRYKNRYQVISQGSPEWLGNQRFDIYFPELNIAIEYQGEQHQTPVDFGGKGKSFANKEFKKNQERDQRKFKKSKSNDCPIIFVYPDYDIKNVIKELNSIIKKQKLKI